MTSGKIVTSLLVLVLGAVVWAQQSETSPQSPAQDDHQPATNSLDSGTVQGCLTGSAGSYALRQDDTGVVVKLSGDDSKLQNHVGHEVAVIGTMRGTSSSSSDQTSVPQPTIEVAQLTEIANTCGQPSSNSDMPR